MSYGCDRRRAALQPSSGCRRLCLSSSSRAGVATQASRPCTQCTWVWVTTEAVQCVSGSTMYWVPGTKVFLSCEPFLASYGCEILLVCKPVYLAPRVLFKDHEPFLKQFLIIFFLLKLAFSLLLLPAFNPVSADACDGGRSAPQGHVPSFGHACISALWVSIICTWGGEKLWLVVSAAGSPTPSIFPTLMRFFCIQLKVLWGTACAEMSTKGLAAESSRSEGT